MLLLVGQNFPVATAVSQKIVVMLNGRIAVETIAAEIVRDEDVQHRYLGVSTH